MSAENFNNGTGEGSNQIRQFINLEKSFLKQLEEDNDVFQNQNSFLLQEKMKISAEALLDCKPHKISLRLTDEGSIFYTLIEK